MRNITKHLRVIDMVHGEFYSFFQYDNKWVIKFDKHCDDGFIHHLDKCVAIDAVYDDRYYNFPNRWGCADSIIKLKRAKMSEIREYFPEMFNYAGDLVI
jgi:hypothetical protein